jgi:hypothetical protein
VAGRARRLVTKGGGVGDKKRCFVLMGFGAKVDYRTNRTLDLDKTYKIIKAAVEAAGLECIRADDIVHSGEIDKPMYELLFNADIAIADLSTSNENAIYELGVRHALKPHTTIVIAEKQFKFPFDLGHLVIRPYEHLGTGIDFEEAERLKRELSTAIQKILPTADTDSPVYTFLPELVPPSIRAKMAAAAAAAQASTPPSATFTALLDAFREAKSHGDFVTARACLQKLCEARPGDVYLIQQRALATYKSRVPTPLAALTEARQILLELQPETSGDPETIALWGAIHKRLWEETADRAALDAGIAAYERAFVMKRDHYSGVNYAFMLDDRARHQASPDEATCDRVLARRIREQLIPIVDAAVKSMPKDANGRVQDIADWYWAEATRVETMMALGDPKFEEARKALFDAAPEPWMRDTTRDQLDKLAERLWK